MPSECTEHDEQVVAQEGQHRPVPDVPGPACNVGLRKRDEALFQQQERVLIALPQADKR